MSCSRFGLDKWHRWISTRPMYRETMFPLLWGNVVASPRNVWQFHCSRAWQRRKHPRCLSKWGQYTALFLVECSSPSTFWCNWTSGERLWSVSLINVARDMFHEVPWTYIYASFQSLKEGVAFQGELNSPSFLTVDLNKPNPRATF